MRRTKTHNEKLYDLLQQQGARYAVTLANWGCGQEMKHLAFDEMTPKGRKEKAMSDIEKLIEGVRLLKERLDEHWEADEECAPLTWADIRELAPKIFPYLPPLNK